MLAPGFALLDPGSCVLSASSRTSWAVVTVPDQGIGISAADKVRLFERFHRAANVRGRIVGTGIGLVAARQVVEQHRGTIELISEEGVGTCAIVRLPLILDDDTAADPSASTACSTHT
ncbi:MAG: ATP-binding protein [Chloroflexi bacterium]|nr:ATP-binding protein [Chloroflexota bacterium]